MDAATLQGTTLSRAGIAMPEMTGGRVINAAEFQKLLVSHRRMVRADRRADRLRGLQDLDTGELFLTDERRLLDFRH
jgi:hypothetical protein